VTNQWRTVVDRINGRGGLWRTWQEDQRGASAVQFIAVLPLFVLLTLGLWTLFMAYSAQQTLCEAAGRTASYLQEEGPWFDEGVEYPTGWVPVAVDLVNSELKSNAMTPMQVKPEDVVFYPSLPRRAPQEQDIVPYSVADAYFYLTVTADVTGTLGVLGGFFDGAGADGKLRLSCRSTAFYEEPPLKSTDQAVPGATECPEVDDCTPGPPPTQCIGPACPTSPPCPPCK